MALLVFLLLGVVLTTSFGLSDDRFINPPDGSSQTGSFASYPVFAVPCVVAWATSADSVDLIINQLDSPDTQIDRPPNSVGLTRGAYSWKIVIDGSDGGSMFDLTFSNVFNFVLFLANSTGTSTQSAFFNISNATVDQHGQLRSTSTSMPTTILARPSTALASSESSTSSASLSTSASSTSSTSATGSLFPETSASSTPTAAPTNKSLKLGLGIGFSIAGVAVIAGALTWLLLRRRKPNPPRISSPPYTQYTDTRFQGKYELPSTTPPAELPS